MSGKNLCVLFVVCSPVRASMFSVQALVQVYNESIEKYVASCQVEDIALIPSLFMWSCCYAILITFLLLPSPSLFFFLSLCLWLLAGQFGAARQFHRNSTAHHEHGVP